jgi:hypothetical protein
MQSNNMPERDIARKTNRPTSILYDFVRLSPLLILAVAILYIASRYGVPVFGRALDPRAEEIRDVRPLSAADVQSLALGAEGLVTGRIGGNLEPGFRRLAIVKFAPAVVSGGEPYSKQADEGAVSQTPAFVLQQPGGAAEVLADTYKDKIWNAPHRGQLGGRTSQGRERASLPHYEGFLPGEVATVKGTVVEDHGKRAIRADLLFGGTPDEFLQSLGGGTAVMVVVWSCTVLLLFLFSALLVMKLRRP